MLTATLFIAVVKNELGTDRAGADGVVILD
jgi:hypothetical protein